MGQDGSSPFQHTHFSMYAVGLCALCFICYDSVQGIVQKYDINKKWFYLYGATCLSAYVYVRPLIRRRLGSAASGYINWSTVYIAWLCGAVFYHLPPLESMGFDVRADLSVLLTTFLLSLTTLGALTLVHGAAVALRALRPRLLAPTGGRSVWVAVLLNSANLAVACSSYYSFCGNAAAAKGQHLGRADLKTAVCGRWLAPLPAPEHPAFAGWVLYGEAVGAAGNATAAASGKGAGGEEGAAAAPGAISPVLTMWLTLAAMFVANCGADYAAAAALSAARTADLHGEAQRTRPGRRAVHCTNGRPARPAASGRACALLVPCRLHCRASAARARHPCTRSPSTPPACSTRRAGREPAAAAAPGG